MNDNESMCFLGEQAGKENLVEMANREAVQLTNSRVTGARVPRTDFGRTGLKVSRIGFGGMELAGPPRSPKLSSGQARNLILAAMDMGINYFDTSIDYGISEELIGHAVRHRRDEVILATKCGCLVGAEDKGESTHVYTHSNIRDGVAQSLKRLNTDYIDVMQFHGNPTRRQLVEEGGLEMLMELKRKGIIRHIGLSTRKPYVNELLDLDILDVYQLPYSSIQRQHEDVAELVSKSGRAVVARGVVARGSVAKEWSSIPIGMADGQAQNIWDKANIDELLGGMSRIEFMIRFVVTSQWVNVVLTGTTNLAHLEENITAAEKGALDADMYDAVLERLTAAGSFPGDSEYTRGGPKPPTGAKK
ncbi:MAG: aldo/keto reductase [Acidimicrobiaceae bacterium]|nr:aldo/keto reductase [Acidimicrobiaceae bacterium]